MPFDPVTHIFTRVSKTFSNPIAGVVISPTDAAALFDDIDDGLTEVYANSSLDDLLGTTPNFFAVRGATVWGQRAITGSDLPNPSTTTLGGAFSLPVTSNSVLSGINNDGTPTRATTTGTGDVVRATSPTIVTSLAVTGTQVITSSSSAAFAVGRQGVTTPAFQVDASAASSTTGLSIVAQSEAAAVVNVAATSSGANCSYTLDGKGAGTINFGITSTGNISFWRVANFMGGFGYNLVGGTSGSTHVQPEAIASGTWTVPAATDTFVGKATTDTLTNKTLTSATLVTKLNGGAFTIAQSGAAVSHTGTVSETTIATIAIPANVMGSNGKVRIEALFSYTGGTAGWTPRLKFGGTTFHQQAFLNTGLSARLNSEFTNANATNAQVAPALAQANFASNSVAYTTMAIDTTSSQNLTITMELGNAGDTVVLRSYTIQLILP